MATYSWSEFRKTMPVAGKWAYFDHAAVAPIPDATRQTVIQWANESACEGDTVWPTWSRRLSDVRHTAAEILGADADEIALVANTTHGINIVAEAFPWIAGDNLITLGNEFPSNLYPWLNLASRQVEARVLPVRGPVDVASIWNACNQRTRLLAISWVGYASGWRNDLDELATGCRQRGIRILVDAIQGLGVFPLNVAAIDVDFVVADGHKWLLGPEGAGVLFVRKSRLEELRPIGVGWHSVKHAFDFSRIETDWRDTAARFEGGSHNMAGFLALGTSLKHLQQFGLSPDSTTIADRVLELTDQACDRLRGLGAEIVTVRAPAHRSGIVQFRFDGRDPQEIRQRCFAEGVVISCRDGGLRISPHAYNDESDLDRLISSLR